MGSSFSGSAAPLPPPPLVLPAAQVEEQTAWSRLGGGELEGPLREGWVALVRADWLVELAERGGKLVRRQELPSEAFVGLEELQAAGSAGIVVPGVLNWEWLRVVVLSYPWLQPGHPDPHAENLRLIARALKAYVQDSVHQEVVGEGVVSFRYVNGGKPYGVLIDFTAMFQKDRTEDEDEKFKLALPALNLFYSHPHTVIFKVTQFPEGYPAHPERPYTLPPGANTVDYTERGWCYAESAMSGLVKDSHMILDLGRLPTSGTLSEVIAESMGGREPPLSPSAFTEQLDRKTFTSKRGDFERVARLYADAFAGRISGATELDYRNLRWGAGGVQQLLQALQSNSGLQKLNLRSNDLGAEGARVLGQALGRSSGLGQLDLTRNGLGAEGARVLGQALERNSGLQKLDLSDNDLGAEGARALLRALRRNGSLRSLVLWNNAIEGAQALEALPRSGSLQVLDLAGNRVGAQGARDLHKALNRNCSLRSLVLSANEMGGECAATLGQALRSNKGLLTLELFCNKDLGDDGARELGQALQRNSCLQKLDLAFTNLGEEGACALGRALENNRSLTALCLWGNRIGLRGARALAQALQRNRALQTLDLGRNRVDSEGALALAEALPANGSLAVLNLGDALDATSELTKNSVGLWPGELPESNRIGRAGARALGHALQRNSGLCRLNVSLHDVGEEGLGLLRQLAFSRLASGGRRLEIDER